MSHPNYEKPILEDSEEIVEEQVVEAEEKANVVFGVVTDCMKLNIRKMPYKDSDVVIVVTCLEELQIDMEKSTDDWYAVCTVSGLEGFCMKKFVAVRR